MANRLKMAMIQSIITLHKRGWSGRRIARELGIARRTVSGYIRQERSKCAIPTAGSGSSKAAISTTGSPGRKSDCEPWRETIEAALERGLSAQRIYQDLVADHGFNSSYESVKRFVRRLSAKDPKRFYRLESLPGEEAQVDFGRGAPIVDENGKKRYPHVFRITLSYSRKSYSEVVYRQTTENFIRCKENAFRYFGGVPDTLVIDNLRAAVTRADWYEPELNPKVEEFCRYYDTVILPTKPRHPHHKGKIESGINYVQENALKGKSFSSLAEQNAYLLHWEEHIADKRIHGTTRKQVGKLFDEHEKQALKALPAMTFPCFQEGPRQVHRDSYVEVQRAYYEVPEEYIGRRVWARWDSKLVKVFNQRMEQIAIHARMHPGVFSDQQQDARRRKTRVERSAEWLQQKAEHIGPACGAWSQAMLKSRGASGIRVMQGLLGLAKKHPYQDIETACSTALAHGLYRLRDVRRFMEQPNIEQTGFEFIQSHPLIRDMEEYGALIK